MTMNVVRPAFASVTRSVPRSANLKYSAIAPPRPEAGIALDVTGSVPPCPRPARRVPWGGLGPRHEPPGGRHPRRSPSLRPDPRWARPPDRLLVLVGFEPEQLHL